MNRKEIIEAAVEDEALNCAQKVVGLYCESYGLPKETGYRIAHPMGGGMRAGEACGALSAAMIVIGLAHGNGNPNSPEDRAYCDAIAADFSKWFREANGHIACRDLLGIDTSVGMNRTVAAESGLFAEICPKVIEKTIYKLEELGYGK